GHYKEELPTGKCDCIAEIDFNSFKKRYEIRLIAVRPSADLEVQTEKSAMILDWRNQDVSEFAVDDSILIIKDCPTTWEDVRAWLRKSVYKQQKLALAWAKPENQTPQEIWLTLVGVAKFISRKNQLVTRVQILEKLGISDPSLYLGFQALKYLGFTIERQDRYLQITWNEFINDTTKAENAVNQFLAALQEEQFQKKYFATVPISTIQAIAFNGLL
ncbi:MAG: single-stranded-DNA-specific exonuclease RecJ, partial [Sphaerospermopsis kisseleviana]